MPEQNPQPEEASPATHRLLTIAYDSGMDERLTEVLDTLELEGWTKTFGAHGFGGTGRKEDTPVWPGTVNIVTILLAETAVEQVVAAIRALQATYRRNPGITIWSQPATRY